MIRLIKARHDSYNRDNAILYIDGKIYVDESHGDALRQYIDEYMPEGKKRDGEKDDWNYLTNNNPELDNIPMAFAHLVKNPQDKEKPGIYLEPDTENCNINDVARAIKEKFPEYEIYDDKSYKELISVASLDKNSVSQMTREKAILYLDGNIYEGENHTQIINKIIEDKMKCRERIEEDWVYTVPLAFVHYQNEDKRYKEGLYIEDDALMNCSIGDVINALKSKYPNIPIYSNSSCDEKTEYFTRLAYKINTKLAFDVTNRDNAILYIDGEVYQSNSHSQCVQEYIKNHFNNDEFVTFSRQDGDEILEEYGLDELPIAFAHLVVNNPNVKNGIYLETNTIKGISRDEVANELKDQYNLDVYDNDTKNKL